MSVRAILNDVLGQAFGPIRHIVPGYLILLALAAITMAAGLYNVVVLPYHGDRAMLVMLALTVYPGPYMFYALFSFFLFHAASSPRMTLIYYLSCLLLAGAPVVALIRRMRQEELSFPQQLDEALFDNFLAALAIGALAFAAMLAMVLANRWLHDDSE